MAPPGSELPDADAQSAGFRANRAARRNVLVADYVELIDDLIESGQASRQKDIAARLGVSQPTVAKMLARLAAEGLVVQAGHRGVSLTPAGKSMATEARARHRVVESFLQALGVSPDVARIDSEGIEHYASRETVRMFEKALALGLDRFMKG